MDNQLSKAMGEMGLNRKTADVDTSPISRQSGSVNSASRGIGSNRNDRLYSLDSVCGSENGSSLPDVQVKGKKGNRGEVLPKMPSKLQPNFGEDPSRRVRKWNKAVERKFEISMEAMSQELKTKTSKIDRGIRNIEDQLKDLDLERSSYMTSSLESQDNDEHEGPRSRFPAIPKSRRRSGRRQGSGHRCSYNPIRTKQKCHHFPCVRPETYHTIGYRGNPDFTPWMSWEEIKESWNAPELVDNISTSAHDVKVSPRMLTLRKEEKLRKEIERRKFMNHLKKPQSWVTNYGQPMSYKQLKYPVRLNPITN